VETLIEKIYLLIASGIIGIITAFITVSIKLKQERKIQEIESKNKIKYNYLDPLRISTFDFITKLNNVAIRVEKKDSLLKDTLTQLSDNFKGTSSSIWYTLWKDDLEFIKWSNQLGHYSMSLLYVSALYFYHAFEIRTKLPYIKLNSSTDSELLDKINNVRHALGGEFGIWDELQDSIGSFIIKKNSNELLDYWQFCFEIYANKKYYYFHRLIEFYQSIDLKTKEEIQIMIDSLNKLSDLLENIQNK
jgi:hypothetical protein